LHCYTFSIRCLATGLYVTICRIFVNIFHHSHTRFLPFYYGGVLQSIRPRFPTHHLLNVSLQIANEFGNKKKLLTTLLVFLQIVFLFGSKLLDIFKWVPSIPLQLLLLLKQNLHGFRIWKNYLYLPACWQEQLNKVTPGWEITSCICYLDSMPGHLILVSSELPLLFPFVCHLRKIHIYFPSLKCGNCFNFRSAVPASHQFHIYFKFFMNQSHFFEIKWSENLSSACNFLFLISGLLFHYSFAHRLFWQGSPTCCSWNMYVWHVELSIFLTRFLFIVTLNGAVWITSLTYCTWNMVRSYGKAVEVEMNVSLFKTIASHLHTHSCHIGFVVWPRMETSSSGSLFARSVTYAYMSTRIWAMLTWPNVEGPEIYRDITSVTCERFGGETLRLFDYGYRNMALNLAYFRETGYEHNATIFLHIFVISEIKSKFLTQWP
jgi:hypothetical protein